MGGVRLGVWGVVLVVCVCVCAFVCVSGVLFSVCVCARPVDLFTLEPAGAARCSRAEKSLLSTRSL